VRALDRMTAKLCARNSVFLWSMMLATESSVRCSDVLGADDEVMNTYLRLDCIRLSGCGQEYGKPESVMIQTSKHVQPTHAAFGFLETIGLGQPQKGSC
jgi:hypothetical protein